MRGLRVFLPPLALMVAIFVVSAQPSLNSGLGWIDTVGRKLLHFSEYALLSVLWWRALRTKLDGNRALALGVAVASAYAATDELHQAFVFGRHGTPVDWMIDTAGALAGAFLVHRYTRDRPPVAA